MTAATTAVQPLVFARPEWVEATGTEYMLQVRGDCMEPGIPDGSFVGVKKQPTTNDGDIVIAKLPEGKVMKRLRVIDGRPFLVPDNPEYDWRWPVDDAEILGVVVGDSLAGLSELPRSNERPDHERDTQQRQQGRTCVSHVSGGHAG